MSSTKVINLGNTCSAFAFSVQSIPPTTTGNYYVKNSLPNNYLILQNNYCSSYCDIRTKTIPASSMFNYNMFNIGLMWSSSIPGGTYNGITYTNGDPKLRILTSYWLENIGSFNVLSLNPSYWTIVSVDPTNPANGFTICRLNTMSFVNFCNFTLISVGDQFAKTTSPVPSTGTITTDPTKYYITTYGAWTPNSSVPKNVFSNTPTIVDLNSTVIDANSIATITVPALSLSTFTTTALTNYSHIDYKSNLPATWVNGSTTYNFKDILYAGSNYLVLFTNIIIGTFQLAPGTTGVLSNNGSYLPFAFYSVSGGSTTAYMQLLPPTGDPDSAFSTASENGIIFQPLTPVTSGYINPVVGFTVNTTGPSISPNIGSYFSLSPPASYGYLLTYPLNYEEANPSIEAGSDFLLLTPNNAYIVYVNGSGALAIQSSSTLTASPSTINFQTYGGYWKAISTGSPGQKGFQLTYVTATTTYYMTHQGAGSGTITFTTTGPGSIYTCMHCSPWAGTFICQQGL